MRRDLLNSGVRESGFKRRPRRRTEPTLAVLARSLSWHGWPSSLVSELGILSSVDSGRFLGVAGVALSPSSACRRLHCNATVARRAATAANQPEARAPLTSGTCSPNQYPGAADCACTKWPRASKSAHAVSQLNSCSSATRRAIAAPLNQRAVDPDRASLELPRKKEAAPQQICSGNVTAVLD